MARGNLPTECPWDLQTFLNETYAFLPEPREITPGEARRFRRQRQQAHLSLQETAEFLQLHPSTLGKWEREKCRSCQVSQAASLQFLRLWNRRSPLQGWIPLLQMRKSLRRIQNPAMKAFFLQMQKACRLSGSYEGLLAHLHSLSRSLEQKLLLWALEKET